MESEDHFYLTLPSSASMDLHPDNKVSDFTTELIFPIQLEREMYEIGLCELILDVNIENVTTDRLAFVIFRSAKFVKTVLKITNVRGLRPVQRNDVKFYWEEFHVKRGLYKSLPDLMRYLNSRFLLSRLCGDLFFQTNKGPNEEYELITLRSVIHANLKDRRSFIFQRSDWFRKCIYLPDSPVDDAIRLNSVTESSLHNLMRYMPTIEEYLEQDVVKVEVANSIQLVCNPSELLEIPGMAYIYTDIVEHQYVGNTKAPVLRVVHIPREQRVLTFPSVHYLPMSKSYLN